MKRITFFSFSLRVIEFLQIRILHGVKFFCIDIRHFFLNLASVLNKIVWI